MPNGIPSSVDITGPITGGDDTTLIVILDQTVTSNTQVNLSVSPTGVLTGPVTVPPNKAPFPTRATVPSGSDRVSVPLSSNAVTSSTVVTVTATANGGSASGTVTVNP